MPLAALSLLLALQTTPPPTPPTNPPALAVPSAPAPDLIPALKDLVITDLVPGKGDEAVRVGDLVEVTYVGKLLGGKEFDRSGDSPFRVQVGLGKVIVGWDQGLLGMKVGGKRRLQIPAALGYGANGAGASIPPNSDLDFEVGLVKIQRAKIETLKPGAGDPLTITDVPTFHYTLTLADGKKVDSSRDRNVPATARLGQLIPGFVQGLLGMRPGEVRKLTIPPALAYGAQGIPPQDVVDEAGKVVTAKNSFVPPNSTLVFEVELVSAAKAGPELAPGG